MLLDQGTWRDAGDRTPGSIRRSPYLMHCQLPITIHRPIQDRDVLRQVIPIEIAVLWRRATRTSPMIPNLSRAITDRYTRGKPLKQQAPTHARR